MKKYPNDPELSAYTTADDWIGVSRWSLTSCLRRNDEGKNRNDDGKKRKWWVK